MNLSLLSTPQNFTKHKDCVWNLGDIKHISSTVVKPKIDAYYEYPSNGNTLSNREVLREFGEGFLKKGGVTKKLKM